MNYKNLLDNNNQLDRLIYELVESGDLKVKIVDLNEKNDNNNIIKYNYKIFSNWIKKTMRMKSI